MAQDLLERATASAHGPEAVPAVVMVFAHPDDETVALGGRLGRFRRARLIHVTDGAPRNGYDSRAYGFASVEDYRNARTCELQAALRLAGMPSPASECLEIPDQEASQRLLYLVHRLRAILRIARPEVIFTHPYEGGHPDHDACAYAVHRAVAWLRCNGGMIPSIVEGAFYHAGPAGIETGCFLPHPDNPREIVRMLSPEEQKQKRDLLDCFTTQKNTLSSFGVELERFRMAPEYGFEQCPHPGPVFYDGFPWGTTSTCFCELVREADAALRVEAACA